MAVNRALRFTALLALGVVVATGASGAGHKHGRKLTIAPGQFSQGAPPPAAGTVGNTETFMLSGLNPGTVRSPARSLLFGSDSKAGDALTADLFDTSNLHARFHYLTGVKGGVVGVNDGLSNARGGGTQHGIGFAFTLSN